MLDSKGRPLIVGAWYAADTGDLKDIGSAALGCWDGEHFIDEEGERVLFWDAELQCEAGGPDYAVLQQCKAANDAGVKP